MKGDEEALPEDGKVLKGDGEALESAVEALISMWNIPELIVLNVRRTALCCTSESIGLKSSTTKLKIVENILVVQIT